MRETNDEVRAKFRRRRNRQLLATAPFFLIILLFAFSGGDSLAIGGLSEIMVGGLVVAVGVGLVLFSLTNWRCPACERYLGRGINPAFCSKCGAQLR